jgi:hypothetical protein
MLMIGYPESDIASLYQYSHKDTTEFAGAAFSGFSVLPVFTAALYGAGLAGLTADPDQALSVVSHLEVNAPGEDTPSGEATSGKTKVKPKAESKSKAKVEAIPTTVTCNELAGSSSTSPHDSSSDGD